MEFATHILSYISIEAVLAIALGVLFACSVYLLLRSDIFQVMLGVVMLSNAIHLFIFSMGRLSIASNSNATLDHALSSLANIADPIPKSLVFTAIVINFAITALILVLVLLSAKNLTNAKNLESPNESNQRSSRSR